MLRLHRLSSRRDDDFAGLCNLRLAPDHIDLVLLQQKADAGIELARDIARALDDGRRIEAELALDGDAVILRMLRVMINFGRAQQRFGRNAAPVEADAAQMFAFDDGGLEAQLRRADRRDIAAGSAADDEDVIGFRHQLNSHQHRHRIFDQALERGDELRAFRAVERAMIAGDGRAHESWRRRSRRSSPPPSPRPCRSR